MSRTRNHRFETSGAAQFKLPTTGKPAEAVEWSSGTSYWLWEGLQIPRQLAARSNERARLQVLVRTRNQELRRVPLEKGLRDVGGKSALRDVATTLLFLAPSASGVFTRAAKRPRFRGLSRVERTGIEPVTFGLQSRRSPS